MDIRCLFLLLALVGFRAVQAGEFVWYNGRDAVNYHLQQRNVSPVVHVALEMFADEAPLKTMRACYSSWGKGILLTAGENAVKFDVYASRAAFVSFEFGTGGNAGSGAYSGAKFAKVIELKQGWNTVTLTFGDNADVQGATLADGIVHFGATTVNSISALPDNGCFPDVASEELTLYVATMYAIVA